MEEVVSFRKCHWRCGSEFYGRCRPVHRCGGCGSVAPGQFAVALPYVECLNLADVGLCAFQVECYFLKVQRAEVAFCLHVQREQFLRLASDGHYARCLRHLCRRVFHRLALVFADGGYPAFLGVISVGFWIEDHRQRSVGTCRADYPARPSGLFVARLQFVENLAGRSVAVYYLESRACSVRTLSILHIELGDVDLCDIPRMFRHEYVDAVVIALLAVFVV